MVLIGIIAIGGVVDACAEAHSDHADLGCLDDCCQPVYTASYGAAVTAGLPVCEPLHCDGRCLNNDPVAHTHFRPPEAA